MNIFSTESYTAQVQAFLVTSTAVRTLPKETQDQVLGELTKNIVDGLKDVGRPSTSPIPAFPRPIFPGP